MGLRLVGGEACEWNEIAQSMAKDRVNLCRVSEQVFDQGWCGRIRQRADRPRREEVC